MNFGTDDSFPSCNDKNCTFNDTLVPCKHMLSLICLKENTYEITLALVKKYFSTWYLSLLKICHPRSKKYLKEQVRKAKIKKITEKLTKLSARYVY